MKIVLNSKVIGEGADHLLIGNEYYFETTALDMSLFIKNTNKLHCPDKGYAECYDVACDGVAQYNVAWIYPHPYPSASELKGKVGFKKSHITFIS